MVLSKNEYEKLLSFFGYGNFPKADILFFGNEEGLGGYPIDANIHARCCYYGRDKNGNYINLLGTTWLDGFYEDNSSCKLSKLSGLNPKKTNGHSNFLEIASRICIALEHNSGYSNKWFQLYNHNKGSKEIIKQYSKSGLFKPQNNGKNSVLIDWRPLPRANEMTWYPVEYSNIDKGKYLKAFKFSNSNNLVDNFTNYTNDVDRRKNIVENVFLKYPFPLGIGMGDIESKKKVIKNIFRGCNCITIYSLGKKWYKISICLPDDREKIFLLLPFPDTRSFRSKINILDFYNDVFKNHISPIYQAGNQKTCTCPPTV